MGADSRATAGNIIADKHCKKIHKITDSIYVCGAGTAADLHQVGIECTNFSLLFFVKNCNMVPYYENELALRQN